MSKQKHDTEAPQGTSAAAHVMPTDGLGDWTTRQTHLGPEWQVIMSDDGEKLWYVAECLDHVNDVPAKDVARMISALPDMYDALVRAEAWMLQVFPDDLPVMKDIRAAIEKANGQ